LNEYGPTNIKVDLDIEEGRDPNPKYPNYFSIHCRPTKKLNLAVIEACLQGKAQHSEAFLEAMSKCNLPRFLGSRTRTDAMRSLY
jgi:hypothetical protein